MEMDTGGDKREQHVYFCLLVEPALRGQHVCLNSISKLWSQIEVPYKIVGNHQLVEHTALSDGEGLDVGDHKAEEVGVYECSDHHGGPRVKKGHGGARASLTYIKHGYDAVVE